MAADLEGEKLLACKGKRGDMLVVWKAMSGGGVNIRQASRK